MEGPNGVLSIRIRSHRRTKLSNPDIIGPVDWSTWCLSPTIARFPCLVPTLDALHLSLSLGVVAISTNAPSVCRWQRANGQDDSKEKEAPGGL